MQYFFIPKISKYLFMNYKFIYIHIPVLYTLGVIEPTKINDDLQMTIRFVLSL